MKKKKNSYAKGLLLRISAACLIFLILYGCRKFSVSVVSYDTDKVITEFEKNEWVEYIFKKADDLLEKIRK